MDNNYINKKYIVLTENIKYFRQKKKITQEQLAEMSDLSVSYIKQIESGHLYKNITFSTIAKISNALDIDISELLSDKLKI